MKFIVLFEDAADADPGLRRKHMKHHLEFLERNSALIHAAGPLSDPKAQGRDGLWIIDVEDEVQAMDLVHRDPFWPTGLRASVSVIPWRQVFCDGQRLIDPT